MSYQIPRLEEGAGAGMKSDGPYKHLLNYLPIDGVIRCALVCPACVYAEGRKAAEKDFQELLELADEAGYFNQDIMIWRMKYADWKKARGIE